MTERERFAFEELKRELLREHPICQVCGKRPSTQCAHRIPKDKPNLRKYGKRIVHHRLNILAVCSLACNDAVSISNHPEEIKALVERIRGELDRERTGGIPVEV